MPSSDRTATVSEFISFLFRSQLADIPTPNDPNSDPELHGMSGMMLRTFSESSRGEEESDYLYSQRSSLNRSRFDSRSDTGTSNNTSTTPSSPSSASGGGNGWRVYGHSRQSSASSSTVRLILSHFDLITEIFIRVPLDLLTVTNS
jgi:hypothetical protein